MSVARPVGISLVNDFPKQPGGRVRAAETEVRVGSLASSEETIQLVPDANIEGEVGTDAEVVLPVPSPIPKALVRFPHHAGKRPAASRSDRSQHELRQAGTASQAAVRIDHLLSAETKASWEAAVVGGVLEPVHKPGLESVPSHHLGDVIEESVGLRRRQHVDPGGWAKGNVPAAWRGHRPVWDREKRVLGDAKRCQGLLDLRLRGDAIRVRVARMRIHVLAAEAGPELINQSRAEHISVSQSNDLAREIDVILGSKSYAILRERWPRPGDAVVPILTRVEEPLGEVLALVAPLMIDFEGEVIRVLATGDRAAEIVAELHSVDQAPRRQRINVVRGRKGFDEIHGSGIEHVCWQLRRENAGLHGRVHSRPSLNRRVHAPVGPERVSGSRCPEGRAEEQSGSTVHSRWPNGGVRIPEAELRYIGVFAEVPLPHQRRRHRVAPAPKAVKDIRIPGNEEERLVLAVVEVGQVDRPAQCPPEVVEAERVLDDVARRIDAREGVASVGRVIADKFVDVPVQLVGSRLEDDIEDSAACAAVFGRERIGNSLKFGDRVDGGVNGNIFSETRKVDVAVQIPGVSATLAAIH